MLELRNQLWSYAFGLFVNPGHRAQVFDLLRSYKNSFCTQPNKVVQQADADQILQFFNDHLKPSNLKHCFFVHDMVNSWMRHNLKVLLTISPHSRFAEPLRWKCLRREATPVGPTHTNQPVRPS